MLQFLPAGSQCSGCLCSGQNITRWCMLFCFFLIPLALLEPLHFFFKSSYICYLFCQVSTSQATRGIPLSYSVISKQDYSQSVVFPDQTFRNHLLSLSCEESIQWYGELQKPNSPWLQEPRMAHQSLLRQIRCHLLPKTFQQICGLETLFELVLQQAS